MFSWPKLGRALPGSNGHNGEKGHDGYNGHHGKNGASEWLAAPDSGPMIDLRGISKTYYTDAGPFLALDGIDLQIYPGEFVAVVGKSGSGKSTLINVFTGIDHPTGGEAIVAQTHIGRLDEGEMAEWRGRHLGIVFQFFQLLPTLTVIENIMLPMDLCQVYELGERRERALYLLGQVGLADVADKFPSAIAGGHQQRAAIARALANDPPIVVADEPTGNLDSRTAEAVFRLFESLVDEGKTILMVTHDKELAARAPRRLTLADGRIVDGVTSAAPRQPESRHGMRPMVGQEFRLDETGNARERIG